MRNKRIYKRIYKERVEELTTKYKEYVESLPEITFLNQTYKAPPALIEKLKNKTISKSEEPSVYRASINIDITDETGSKEVLKDFNVFGNLADFLCEHYNIPKPMTIILNLQP